MPAKSQAQVRKLAQLKGEGKISGGTFSEWLRGVDVKKLPEKVRKKERGKK